MYQNLYYCYCQDCFQNYGRRGSFCYYYLERNYRQNDRQDKVCYVGFYVVMGRVVVIGRMIYYIVFIR